MPTRIYARLEKSVNRPEACLGDTVIFTVEIENINTHPLMDIVFRDAIPQGFNFQQGSVEIDGMQYANANPYQGFSVPNIHPGDTVEIKFIAEASYIPADNPAINIANIEFRTTSQDDEQTFESESSNPVPVIIKSCECDEGSCEKTICKLYSISLPFTVKPFARKEIPDIICFGEEILREGHMPCPNPQREFNYTLTQRVKVELPVSFGAEVCYEEPCMEDDGKCEAP